MLERDGDFEGHSAFGVAEHGDRAAMPRDDLMDDDISLDNALADIRTVLLQAMYRLNELS